MKLSARYFTVPALMCVISLSCSRQPSAPCNEDELTALIKEYTTQALRDSISDSRSLVIDEWIYIATGRLDSLRNCYEKEGLFVPPADDRYTDYVIDVSEYEDIFYRNYTDELYITGGFHHQPDTIKIPRDIHIDGRKIHRHPSSHLSKNGYANYWQLAGEYPVDSRVYFSLWYFAEGYIPKTDSYIAAVRYHYNDSGIELSNASIILLDDKGKLVDELAMQPYHELMRTINSLYWQEFAAQHSPDDIEEHIDDVVLLGDGHAVDISGYEYDKEELPVNYGDVFGSWR